MSLWFAQNRRPRRDSGKFRTRARLGTARSPDETYRDWSFRMISHSTGSSVRRTTYNVLISDPARNQIAYLRDFPNIEQATTAARTWIDRRLSRIRPTVSADLGTIPAVPSSGMSAQEK